jgi:hypothetical protein
MRLFRPSEVQARTDGFPLPTNTVAGVAELVYEL